MRPLGTDKLLSKSKVVFSTWGLAPGGVGCHLPLCFSPHSPPTCPCELVFSLPTGHSFVFVGSAGLPRSRWVVRSWTNVDDSQT